MKRLLSILLLSLFFVACKQPERGVNDVRITVEVTGVPDTSVAFITGNHRELGQWNPDYTEMNRVGNVHQFDVFVPKGDTLEFKITLGSWETEGRINDERVNPNFRVVGKQDTVIYLRFKRWSIPEQPSTLVGTLMTWELPDTAGLFAGRKVRIWLPEDRDSASTVLYMMDGQNLFDAQTAGPAGEWGLDEFFSQDSIHSPIIVGIDNSPNRDQEYSDGDTGMAFRNWIVNTVVDTIDRAFGTRRDASGRLIAGSSAGGMLTTLIMTSHPDIFGGAICFSPALELHALGYDFDVVSPFINRSPKPFPLYMSMSLQQVDTLLMPGYEHMVNALDSLGWKSGEDYRSVIDSTGAHNESSWNALWPAAWAFMELHGY